MEDSVDYGLIARDFVKNRVRESSNESSVVTFVNERIHKGMSVD